MGGNPQGVRYLRCVMLSIVHHWERPYGLRRIAKLVRARANWVIQPVRTRMAIANLRRQCAPRSILFVCQGNICRSPYAAGALVRDLPEELRSAISVDSRGFLGPDRRSPPAAVGVAIRRGVDLSKHKSRLISRESVQDAQIVFVMSRAQRRDFLRSWPKPGSSVLVLSDLAPAGSGSDGIPDPIDGPELKFVESYALIDQCVDRVVKTLCLSSGRHAEDAIPLALASGRRVS